MERVCLGTTWAWCLLVHECVVGMGVQGTVTALQPSCLWAPSLLQVQPREEKMLILAFIRKPTKCLQIFKALQLVSCEVLAQGMFLQRNMVLKNSNNPILISLLTFIKAIF